MNHYAGKVVVGAQENLMKARDERVSLMNEVNIDGALYVLRLQLIFRLRFWVASV